MIITPELSKAVGLEWRQVEYPKDHDEVAAATHYRLLEWHRFLPSPTTDKEHALLTDIEERMDENPIEEE